jgi:hypothetical protein
MSDEGRGEATATGDSLTSVPRSEDMGRIIGTKTPAAPVAQPAAKSLPDAGKPLEQAQPHGYDFKGYANEDNAARYDSFGNVARSVNATPEQVEAFVKWDAEQGAQFQKDYDAVSDATFSTLQQRWGGQFEPNVKALSSYISANVLSVQKALTYLAEIHPDGAQLLLNWATHTPIDMADPRPGDAGELAELEKKVGTREYWKSEAMQQRYRELVGGQPVQQLQESRDGRYERGDRRRSVPS